MSRALSLLTVAVTVAVLAAVLLAASRHGEASRCAWLAAHKSPAASTYDCPTTGAP